MPLPAYGLLIGEITSSRPQTGGHPHWLLMVQASTPGHPPYRVAINLQSEDASAPLDIEYQVIDIDKDGTKALKALAAKLRATKATPSFLVGEDLPTLDFVRGGLLDPSAFQQAKKKSDPLKSAFKAALQEAASVTSKDKALVAVFGTGYPVDKKTGLSPSTGYTGVDNIHMNQGAFNKVGAPAYYLENGANQDGGLIFLLPSGAKAFFVKFASQTVDTDASGNPVPTGVPEIDAVKPAVRDKIFKAAPVVAAQRAVKKAAAAASAAPGPAARGFVFADPDPNDADESFVVDDDSATFNTPWVQKLSKGGSRGPVPTPKRNPIMQLSDIWGSTTAIPGYQSKGAEKSIQFDMVGDSGAADQRNWKEELGVGALIAQFAKTAPPAFMFHLGDVVYYYGEKPFYYGQFADVFKLYPAPIFAIPGNHDGITANDTEVSLQCFQAAFCADTPGRWDGFGGVQRSTMTQPGVYFTLDTPLASIIGLYSNCGESLGWLDQQQLLFLHNELVRLGDLRKTDKRAIILAIHHCPRWFPGATPPDVTSAAIDAACTQAGIWPDAVTVGHAHLYQRIVRDINKRSIPYIVNGCGGHGIEPAQQLAKTYVKTLPGTHTALVLHEGFVRVTVTIGAKRTLKFEYHTVNTNVAQPEDSCTIDLDKGALL